MEHSYNWLEWAKKIQAIAQTGLTYTKDEYDKERYEELRELSKEILSTYTHVEMGTLTTLFTNESGYATPKIDIRGIVLKEGKLLFVKEKADNKWSLPGGWADIGISPAQIAKKEVKEEAGIEVEVKRVLAIFDRQKHPHPPSPYHIYKICFLCDYKSGHLEKGLETSDVAFFDPNHLPELSLERITHSQIDLLLKAIYEKSCYFE
ncbi:NUDIX hydrolase [Pseudogracilibacillus auburnensis]|uniref:ADP-ribose pyrophosphatase YjhB (NUDIX family) n=1 Tax=Pseudogracilibacillus auburnensis TaxID=1494959 RepID=A0A2V3W9W3_9BACI|nr:NUDIX hydrolase [Pseudogracilibacillus auburnensis]PXW85549.1 ADP-ribose pyrophosphatase YjhB (NUDIX family) [Pseudogracilibacillus auburnensis]